MKKKVIGNEKWKFCSVMKVISWSFLEHLPVHCVASPLALHDLALRRVFLPDGGAVVHN